MRRRALLPAAAAAMIVPRHVLGGPGYQAPSDTLTIAGVGVGGMGRRYLQGCESERIVALCDVDHDFAAKVFARYPKASTYRDYREMFDREKNIDAVILATPDHHHALIQMQALRRRKHVYSAKPLTHTLNELRTVTTAAREAKVATQMSVQTCASDEALSVAEILRSGTIGTVSEVHVWCDHPLYPAGLQRPEPSPVPPGLTWDLWLGPAPERPFNTIYHPWTWRSWWDFGTGTVGDMACHAMHVFLRCTRTRRSIVCVRTSNQDARRIFPHERERRRDSAARHRNAGNRKLLVRRDLGFRAARHTRSGSRSLVRRWHAAPSASRTEPCNAHALVWSALHRIEGQDADCLFRRKDQAAAGEAIQRFRTAAQNVAAQHRPLPRMDTSLQRRPSRKLQLGFCGTNGRNRTARNFGCADCTTSGMGQCQSAHHERQGG